MLKSHDIVTEEFNSNNDTEEKPFSMPHPIIAGIIDFYIYCTVFAGVVAFISAIMGFNIFEINIIWGLVVPLLLTILVMIFCIIYYVVLSNKVKWLTIGEKIVGRQSNNGVKYWYNPYKVNRWGIFFFILIQIIILGNSLDGITEGEVYLITTLVGKYIRIGLTIYGLVLLGKGNIKAMFIFIAIHILDAIVMASIGFGLLFGIVLLVIDLLVLLIYSILMANIKS